jgi:hypothetical protein
LASASFLPGRQQQTLRRRGLLRLLPMLPLRPEPLLPLGLPPPLARLLRDRLLHFPPEKRLSSQEPRLPRPRRLRLELRGPPQQERRQRAAPEYSAG